MAEIEAGALRESCERRLAGMDNLRQPWRSAWMEVAEFTQPLKGRWLCEDARSKRAKLALNKKMLMGVGRRASRVLQAGLSAGLTSPSRPWFRLTTLDPDLRQQASVKAWLKATQDALYELFGSTNFYTASKNGFLELGLFGVEAAFMTQHWEKRAVVHSLTAGEYWLGISAALEPDSLYRHCPMTVAQMVQKFGRAVSPTVMALYDKSNYDQMVDVMHAVEPNPERVPGMVDKTNMLFRSVYWEKGAQRGGVLAFDGFEQQPFWAPRWDAMGGEPYGGAPGIDAFGDLRQLQLQKLRLAQAIDTAARPTMVAPTTMQNAMAGKNVPGGIIFAAPQDKNTWGPLYEVQGPAIEAIESSIEKTEQQVSDDFYEDLFKALINVAEQRDITARQADLMSDEKWTMLGPVIENVMNEKLRVAINIGWSILAKTRTLPPAPPELHGAQVKVEFVSVLAQLQRAAEITAIEQTVAFAGSLAGVDEGAMDNIDIDETINIYADYRAAPPQMLRPTDAVAQLRQQRAQAKQTATLQAAAPAAKDGAAAASLLANTEVGAGNSSLLSSLMGYR